MRNSVLETDRRTDGQTDRHSTSARVELRFAAKNHEILFYWIFTLFTNDGKDLIRDIVSNIEDCAIDSVLTATH